MSAGAKTRQSSAAAGVMPPGSLSPSPQHEGPCARPPSRSGALAEGVENMPQVGGECRELLAGGGMQDFQVN